MTLGERAGLTCGVFVVLTNACNVTVTLGRMLGWSYGDSLLAGFALGLTALKLLDHFLDRSPVFRPPNL